MRTPCSLLALASWLLAAAGAPAAEPPAASPAGSPALSRAEPRTVVFFGDSLTAGYGLADPAAEAYPALIQKKIDAAHLAWRVVNAGLSGETSSGGARRIEWILRQPVDAFVLALGGNDGLRGIEPAVTRANLQRIIDRFPGASTMISTRRNIERVARFVDVLVGAVLVPGERTPLLVPREVVRSMKPRSAIVDIDIDEGGCVETARPTTHDQPIYLDEGVLHYCDPNIPGVVARTCTHSFVNAAMPFIMEMAEKGVETAIAENPAIEIAVNAQAGKLLHLGRLTARKDVDDGLD